MKITTKNKIDFLSSCDREYISASTSPRDIKDRVHYLCDTKGLDYVSIRKTDLFYECVFSKFSGIPLGELLLGVIDDVNYLVCEQLNDDQYAVIGINKGKVHTDLIVDKNEGMATWVSLFENGHDTTLYYSGDIPPALHELALDFDDTINFEKLEKPILEISVPGHIKPTLKPDKALDAHFKRSSRRIVIPALLIVLCLIGFHFYSDTTNDDIVENIVDEYLDYKQSASLPTATESILNLLNAVKIITSDSLWTLKLCELTTTLITCEVTPNTGTSLASLDNLVSQISPNASHKIVKNRILINYSYSATIESQSDRYIVNLDSIITALRDRLVTYVPTIKTSLLDITTKGRSRNRAVELDSNYITFVDMKLMAQSTKNLPIIVSRMVVVPASDIGHLAPVFSLTSTSFIARGY